MAIKKTIIITAETKEADKNLNSINSTLEEQRGILIDLEKELIKAENIREKTSKTNLAGQKQAIEQVNHLKNSIKDQKLALRSLNIERRQASDALNEINAKTEISSGAFKILDQLTGGLASKLRDTYEATKIFNKALKGTKTALIATGIGALVVALGLVVAYWDDIRGFVTGVNKELEDQLTITKKLGDNEQRNLKILNSQDDTLRLQGKTQKEINLLKIEALKNLLEQRKQEAILAKQRLDELEEIQKAGGSTLESFARTYGNFFTSIYKQIDSLFSKIGINLGLEEKVGSAQEWVFEGLFGTQEDIDNAKKRTQELEEELVSIQNTVDGLKLSNIDLDKPKELEEDKGDTSKEDVRLLDLEDKRKTLQEIEDLENEFLESKLGKEQLELNAVREKYFGIIEAAREAGEETLILEEAQQSAIDAVKKKYADIQDARDKKQKKDEEKRDEAVANAKVNIRDRTSQLIQEIAGKDSAVGKGVAVASATISGIEGVQNAYTTASKSPITAVFPAYPAIQAGLAGAFSALQIKKILSTDATGKSGGGATTSGGVGGGASQPSAPSFNLVQGTGTNQIAESIGNQNRPIQAYVVSGSVTSAQELDRNIIESSTI